MRIFISNGESLLIAAGLAGTVGIIIGWKLHRFYRWVTHPRPRLLVLE